MKNEFSKYNLHASFDLLELLDETFRQLLLPKKVCTEKKNKNVVVKPIDHSMRLKSKIENYYFVGALKVF